MALWLARSGKYGEHESRFLDTNAIYLTWRGLEEVDLTAAADYEAVKAVMVRQYPGEPPRRVGNWTGQVWAFTVAMKPGDLVLVPSKAAATVAVGEITGPYRYEAGGEAIYRHVRSVRWLNTAVPRSAFDQDLLYSMGAVMTICEIRRNEAERRVRAMAARAWTGTAGAAASSARTEPAEAEALSATTDPTEVDLEAMAQDGIAQLIIQRFQGHGLARLVDAVLRAQGLSTHLSPPGPDRGIDILAAGGAFGFDAPRLCVQVKSGDTPADRPEFTQLIGAMQSVGATQGLFVSWSGFKPTVQREVPAHFFKVRLWSRNELIAQLLENYERLDADIRAELPLKRIWMVAHPEE